LSSDLARLKSEVERYEGPGHFSQLCAFLAESGGNYELSLEHVLHKDYPSALSTLSLLRPDVLWALLRMRPWTSVYGRVSKYFQTERMRRVWTFSSMYMGMSPYRAPGTYSLLQYSETVHGIGYPRGGFQAVCKPNR
jgi:phytoene desaturase (3,4-didehydrolycopene-forming)